jgi:hypothetical protein
MDDVYDFIVVGGMYETSAQRCHPDCLQLEPRAPCLLRVCLARQPRPQFFFLKLEAPMPTRRINLVLIAMMLLFRMGRR